MLPHAGFTPVPRSTVNLTPGGGRRSGGDSRFIRRQSQLATFRWGDDMVVPQAAPKDQAIVLNHRPHDDIDIRLGQHGDDEGSTLRPGYPRSVRLSRRITGFSGGAAHSWRSMRKTLSDAAHEVVQEIRDHRQHNRNREPQLPPIPSTHISHLSFDAKELGLGPPPTLVPSSTLQTPQRKDSGPRATTGSPKPPPSAFGFPLAPSSSVTSATSSETDFTNLFSTSSSHRASASVRHYVGSNPPAYASSELLPLSHHSNRSSLASAVYTSRVSSAGASSKVFLPPNLQDVLPFVSSPFSAWDAAGAEVVKEQVVEESTLPMWSASTLSSTATSATDGWHLSLGTPGGTPCWRSFHDAIGEVGAVYKVGYESGVLDLEARLHETMYELAGGSHTFVDKGWGEEPIAVLDLGTGTGLWPISQALQWPNAHFIGADLVPCYTDVGALAAAETRARTCRAGVAPGKGMWASAAERIEFQQFNFLDGLPYDSGVFDMVHMRFLGLGVPETSWAELLDDAVRVLRPGGVLEIVEMSFDPPASAPLSVSNSFSSLLLSDFVHPNPPLALQLHLPATRGVTGTTRPVLQQHWAATEPAPGALRDAGMTWLASALKYKCTAFARGKRYSDMGGRAAHELAGADHGRWNEVPEGDEGVGSVALSVWVITKT